MIKKFRYQCVLDWGLAKDLGIPVQDDVSIGYWGHQCDGDEPSLSFGFILLRNLFLVP